MKTFMVAMPALAGLLTAGVKTGYDRLADFSQYRTYSWIGAKPVDNPWAARIVHDADAQLARKGWTKVQSGGDMVVSAFGRTRDAETLQSYYTDVDGGWKWQGFGDAKAAEETPVGTLLVDVFDGKSKKLIWRGSATEVVSARPDSVVLQQSIEYMFRDFPKVTVNGTGSK
jgi:hypothetical protein